MLTSEVFNPRAIRIGPAEMVHISVTDVVSCHSGTPGIDELLQMMNRGIFRGNSGRRHDDFFGRKFFQLLFKRILRGLLFGRFLSATKKCTSMQVKILKSTSVLNCHILVGRDRFIFVLL